mmetsp:Transcript_14886/g.25357  ORF Transcript_14886/g.25357 Transcript_14886/m.25357 type:complete len:173 (+) Transcript_14886:361-879(+)
MSHLKNLVTINLSQNCISKIEGLAGLDQLLNLDLSSNILSDTESCHELLFLPALSNLDLKNNQIDDREKIVPFFSRLQSLQALYLKGNPCIRFISKYRKTLTANIRSLHYLDDRPVFEIERLSADAWLRGGEEEEKRVRLEYGEKKRQQQKGFSTFAKHHIEEGKRRRKAEL